MLRAATTMGETLELTATGQSLILVPRQRVAPEPMGRQGLREQLYDSRGGGERKVDAGRRITSPGEEGWRSKQHRGTRRWRARRPGVGTRRKDAGRTKTHHGTEPRRQMT